MSERDPQAALAYLQIVQALCGHRLLERYFESWFMGRFFERMLDPDRLLYMSERDPQAALAYLQMLQALSGHRLLERYFESRFMERFFERMLDPDRLLHMSERDLPTVMAQLEILRELGGERYVREYLAAEMGMETLRATASELRAILRRNPSTISLLLTIARLTNHRNLTEALNEAISELLRRGDGGKALVAALPISTLSDLRWLANESSNAQLGSVLAELTAVDDNPLQTHRLTQSVMERLGQTG
jgi:hypothetical protein